MGLADESILEWIYINICKGCQWKIHSELAHSFFQLLVKILGHLIERARTSGLIHLSCCDWQPVHHIWKAPHRTSIVYPEWSTPLIIYRLQDIKYIRIINSKHLAFLHFWNPNGRVQVWVSWPIANLTLIFWFVLLKTWDPWWAKKWNLSPCRSNFDEQQVDLKQWRKEIHELCKVGFLP